MGEQTVVQTVMIINREDGATNAARIIGSDLYVGNNSLPYLNTACGAMPQATGVYSCGGKIGRYLGLYKPSTATPLNISQIRAYAYIANHYPHSNYFTSTIIECGTSSNLIFSGGALIN